MKIFVFWFNFAHYGHHVIEDFMQAAAETGRSGYELLTHEPFQDGYRVVYQAPDLAAAMRFSAEFKEFLWKQQGVIRSWTSFEGIEFRSREYYLLERIDQLEAAVRNSIDVAKRTRRRFGSKRLQELRKKLENVLGREYALWDTAYD